MSRPKPVAWSTCDNTSSELRTPCIRSWPSLNCCARPCWTWPKRRSRANPIRTRFNRSETLFPCSTPSILPVRPCTVLSTTSCLSSTSKRGITCSRITRQCTARGCTNRLRRAKVPRRDVRGSYITKHGRRTHAAEGRLCSHSTPSRRYSKSSREKLGEVMEEDSGGALREVSLHTVSPSDPADTPGPCRRSSPTRTSSSRAKMCAHLSQRCDGCSSAAERLRGSEYAGRGYITAMTGARCA